jgi:hypothetical protein
MCCEPDVRIAINKNAIVKTMAFYKKYAPFVSGT